MSTTSTSLKKRIFAFTGAVMGTLLVSAAAGSGSAVWAQNNAAATFASVDMQRVLTESKARQQSAQEFGALQQNLQGVLRRLEQGSARFLSDAEIRDLVRLYENQKPTDADKKRIGDLEQKGDLAAAQLRRLEQIASPDDAQRKQFADLNQSQQKGAETLQTVLGDYQKRLGEREREIQTKLEANIRTAIAQVAKEKGIVVVFPSQVALYAANDITADVLKVLNK